jgi:hypothetical protein
VKGQRGEGIKKACWSVCWGRVSVCDVEAPKGRLRILELPAAKHLGARKKQSLRQGGEQRAEGREGVQGGLQVLLG